MRFLAVFWLFGVPLLVAFTLLANGHLLAALVSLVFLGWAWPTLGLALFVIDREWFTLSPAHKQAAGVLCKPYFEFYVLNPDKAPNGLIQWANNAPYAAITFPGYVFLRNDITPQHTTPAHESKHVQQQLAWGPLFLVIYWVMHYAQGYRGNSFEKSARAHAKESA